MKYYTLWRLALFSGYGNITGIVHKNYLPGTVFMVKKSGISIQLDRTVKYRNVHSQSFITQRTVPYRTVEYGIIKKKYHEFF